MRPVVERGGFVDFLSLTMDQLVNHAAKLRYMLGGKGSDVQSLPCERQTEPDSPTWSAE